MVCFLGHRAHFLLPDRSKYVDMEKRFLHSYMDLLVQTCHRRGALATGGMAALLLPGDKESDLLRLYSELSPDKMQPDQIKAVLI